MRNGHKLLQNHLILMKRGMSNVVVSVVVIVIVVDFMTLIVLELSAMFDVSLYDLGAEFDELYKLCGLLCDKYGGDIERVMAWLVHSINEDIRSIVGK